GGTPVVDENPAALSVLAAAAARYPANDFTVGDGLNTGGFRFNAKIPAANNTDTARLDSNVTRNLKHLVAFRVIFQDDCFDTGQRFPDTPTVRRTSRPWGTSTSYTWTISSSLTNNFRHGFTRQKFSNSGDAQGDTLSFRSVFTPLNFDYPFTRQT